jgi:RNA polymerase sigma-70 factor, ECF subfamily
MESEQIIQVLLRDRIRITASAVVVMRDVHAADDVFQQVVLTALEKRADFNDPEHLFAWAVRTARFRGIDLARKNRVAILPDDVLDLLERDVTSVDAAESDRATALRHCLSKLPLNTREILHSRYHEGLPVPKIAERVQSTTDAIYQVLSRAHRALRVCVEKELAHQFRGVNQ